MLIQRNQKIIDLQQAFNNRFPGLKIVFYKKQHGDHEGSLKDLEYDSDQLLSVIQPDIKDGKIDLEPSKTVTELEQEFEAQFGLNVQVFRRSNTIWLQTVKTDDWTLDVQNSKGLRSIQTNQ